MGLTGLTGKVHKIDSVGDAYIAFAGLDVKQWVKKANLCNLEVVMEGAEATSMANEKGAIAAESFVEGSCVQVSKEMRSNSKVPIELKAGTKGRVHKIDKDGDAL